MRWLVGGGPVEGSPEHRLLCQWIRYVPAMLLVGFGELLSPAAADRLGKLALEIAEERKRPAGAPLVAHEQERRRWREKRDGPCPPPRPSRRQPPQPPPPGAGADLVVGLPANSQSGSPQKRTRVPA